MSSLLFAHPLKGWVQELDLFGSFEEVEEITAVDVPPVPAKTWYKAWYWIYRNIFLGRGCISPDLHDTPSRHARPNLHLKRQRLSRKDQALSRYKQYLCMVAETWHLCTVYSGLIVDILKIPVPQFVISNAHPVVSPLNLRDLGIASFASPLNDPKIIPVLTASSLSPI